VTLPRSEQSAYFSKQQFTSEIEVYHKNGNTCWLEISEVPSIENSEKHTGYEGIAHDITERKKIAQSLRESRESLQSVLDNLPDVFYRTDMQGLILFISPASLKSIGYLPEEMIGKPMTDFYHNPDDRKKMADAITHGGGTATQVEASLKNKSGEIIWVSTNATIRTDPSGKPFCIEGIARNISDKKKAEEELKQAKLEAEKATRVKSDFLANMSHEIRTPMNGIIVLTYLCLKTEVSPKQKDYLTKLSQSANSLLGIINDILDFSKIEAGKLDIENVNFDLQEVLTNLSSLTAIKAHNKNLEFVIDCATDIPFHLIGDPLRLGQVLLNLTDNAIKFTSIGRVIILIELISETSDSVTINFSIKDTGTGITEEQKSKLFKPFSQADTSTTRKYGGTGLGLTISNNLVNLMNSKIDVESEFGRGTIFSFSSIFEKQKNQPTPNITLDKGIIDQKVLIFESQESTRLNIVKILQSFHMQASSVNDFKEGMNLFKKESESNPFRLIIFDWNFCGKELMDEFSKNKGLSKTPFLAMINSNVNENGFNFDVENCTCGLLIKPVNRSSLFNAIEEALGFEIIQNRSLSSDDVAQKLAKHQLGGTLILLVEDNEINQEVGAELLKMININVRLASNGIEAVQQIKSNDFDGILMDVQMPKMDGFEATKIIRSDQKYSNLPILAMTANAMKGDKLKCIEAGMNDHISKPINPNEFYKALLKWITPSNQKHIDISIQHNPQVKIDQFPKMEGFERDKTYDRVGGRLDTYKKLLSIFVLNNKKTIENITDALGAGDLKKVNFLVHTLVGVAGNIGAKTLFESSSELEELFNANKDSKRQLEKVKLHLNKAFDEIHKFTLEVSNVDIPVIDGIDTKIGLNRVNQNRQVYLKIL
ncbi:MAG: response regulator, partial [Flavobacteriaceae bacterium]|nr:response regulator [Flavobacteriaceae bacterium]